MPFATDERRLSDTDTTDTGAAGPYGASLKTLEELALIVSQFASSDGWLDRVRLRAEHRWYERLHHGPDYDIWAISWMSGQSTGYHDHGASAGAFVVATGVLEEHRPGKRTVVIPAGEPRSFGSEYAHDVRNASAAPAVSIHAYSPPLTEMNEYDLEGHSLVLREHSSERAQSLDAKRSPAADRHPASSVDRMLSAARNRLRRATPEQAFEVLSRTGAILVDIRPEGLRATEGHIPGALLVERNVLEWRFDPECSSRLPIATDHDLHVIVFCSEGYTSSLAAAALQDLGLWRATDIVGGFQAWRAAGLPIASSSHAA